MPAFLDVKQLVEGIAVREPRGAFLVGAEQVARAVECESDRKADARADDFAPREVGSNAQDGAALAGQIVVGLAGGVDQVGVRVVGGAQAEQNAAVAVDGHAQRVNAVRQLFPAVGHHDRAVGSIVAVGIDDQHAFALGGHEHAATERVARRRERHADGAFERAAVVKRGRRVFQAVAIGVGQQQHAAVVTERH